MLGVPVADRHKFHNWSRRMLNTSASRFRMLRILPSAWRFAGYIRRLIRVKRKSPKDDLLSGLVLAEENGQSLNDDELQTLTAAAVPIPPPHRDQFLRDLATLMQRPDCSIAQVVNDLQHRFLDRSIPCARQRCGC
jgi:hypothetical protein